MRYKLNVYSKIENIALLETVLARVRVCFFV